MSSQLLGAPSWPTAYVIEIWREGNMTGGISQTDHPQAVYSNLAGDVILNPTQSLTVTRSVSFENTTPIYDIRYSITPEEDSIEASFSIGLPGFGSDLDIGIRDVVIIYTRAHRIIPGWWTSIPELDDYYDDATLDDDEFWPRFVGRIISAPSLNALTWPIEFRAMGLKQELYELDSGVNLEHAAGTGIGTVIVNFMSPVTKPDWYNGTNVLSSVNTTAAVNANSSSVGEFVEAMANLNEGGGERIYWGVSPYMAFFFRNSPNAGDYSDDIIAEIKGHKEHFRNPVVEIEYPPVVGDELVTRVRWILADGWMQPIDVSSHGKINLATPDTLTHLSPSSGEVTTYGTAVRVLQPPPEISALMPHSDAFPTLLNAASKLIKSVDSAGSQDASVTANGSATVGTGKTLSVNALTDALPSGTVLPFETAGGIGLFRLTSEASASATSITGDLYYTAIASADVAPGLLNRMLEFGEASYCVLDVDDSNGIDFGCHFTASTPETEINAVLVNYVFESSTTDPNFWRPALFQLCSGVKAGITLVESGDFEEINETYIWGDRVQALMTNTYDAANDDTSNPDYLAVEISSASSVDLQIRVHEMIPLTINSTDLDNVFEGEKTIPKLNPARITVEGEVTPFRKLAFTDTSGSVISTLASPLDVESFEVGINTETGVRTTIVVGERIVGEAEELTNAINRVSTTRQTRAYRRGMKRRRI